MQRVKLAEWRNKYFTGDLAPSINMCKKYIDLYQEDPEHEKAIPGEVTMGHYYVHVHDHTYELCNTGVINDRADLIAENLIKQHVASA